MTTPNGPYPPAPPYVSAQDNQPAWPTLFPPPVQGLAKAYFTPHMAPTPVATRVPKPGRDQDVAAVSGFLRIQAGGGVLRQDGFLFDVVVNLHAYAPNNSESLAEIICMRAVAIGGNAQGQMIVHPSLNRPWFIAYSRVQSLAVMQADPLVNMVRFKASCLWRTQGMLDPLPNDTDPLDAGV
ncbi:hypothetical protein VT930_11925 [Mycobacterium sherrisii]|uniref:hypothetical protein n=1 Tax=Mycobacterium sherrisii TaxID=243061 RepID=UPI002DDCFB14|nr:hypothetical protein [Mycobacterium sherrisii]MEC4763812.1 hypothetical protein [Mycobacterium sherrisii]